MARPTKRQAELAKLKENSIRAYRYDNLDECISENLIRATKIIEETDWMGLRCNKSVWIENNILLPLEHLKDKKYHKVAIDELDMDKTLDYITKITNLLSEHTRYMPSLVTYCRVLCIATTTFDNWALENSDRGEKAREILDYFKSMLVQGMTTGEYNPVAGSFIGKTTLGMKENDGSKTNINVIATEMSLEQIMSEYEKNRK